MYELGIVLEAILVILVIIYLVLGIITKIEIIKFILWLKHQK